MSAGTIKLTGARELDLALRNLDRKIARKLVRQALRAGAKIIRDEAQQNAPVLSGQLKKSIKVRAAKSRRRGVIRLQVQTADGDYAGDEFYASFIEYGFMKQETRRLEDGSLISLKRGSGTPTYFPPRPFMRPAFESKKHEAARLVETTLRESIEREAAKK